ncbi:MAG: prolipoprotein diacylglyceryl transferase [Myxococcales bacterium]|nr:prolipoprotein diacylglyceryl transferase [Myxococcales bacterium]
MLPYIDIPPLKIYGPLQIYPFGALVATGIIVGTIIAGKRAERLGMNRNLISEMATWAVVPGFIVAHLYSILFYFPERVLEEPLVLLKFWDGISSFGGFVGGTAGVFAYFYRRKLPFWPHADAVIYGFVFAWIFGRLGCSVAHDHPGLPTDFFLAINYPKTEHFDAGPRHDLGFYEFLWAVAVSAYFYTQRNKPKFTGWYLTMFGILYAPVRFLFDFLRTADKRYAGLTPGQFAAIAFFFVAIWVYQKRKSIGELLGPDHPWRPPNPDFSKT